MRRKTKRTEENSAGTRCGATAGKTEPEYEEKQGGIPKRQQVRTPRKNRSGRRGRTGPALREKAGPDAEEEQARTPRKSRPGRRGRTGPDAEEEQARTPRESRPGRRGKAGPDAEEPRESKPGLLKDSDAPLKKNRIGPLKKKTQDQASDGQRRRETGKAQAGVPKDSGAADRQDGAGTGKPSKPQHFSSKSSASIHAGNFSLKAA